VIEMQFEEYNSTKSANEVVKEAKKNYRKEQIKGFFRVIGGAVKQGMASYNEYNKPENRDKRLKAQTDRLKSQIAHESLRLKSAQLREQRQQMMERKIKNMQKQFKFI